MHFDGEEDGEVVEGEVVDRFYTPQVPKPPPVPQWDPGAFWAGGSVPPQGASGPGMWTVDQSAGSQAAPAGAGFDATGLVDAGVSLASNSKSRSIALLVKIPLFAYVALNHKMPPLVRLAAAALGAMETLEVFQRQSDYQQIADDAAQGYY